MGLTFSRAIAMTASCISPSYKSQHIDERHVIASEYHQCFHVRNLPPLDLHRSEQWLENGLFPVASAILQKPDLLS